MEPPETGNEKKKQSAPMNADEGLDLFGIYQNMKSLKQFSCFRKLDGRRARGKQNIYDEK